MKTCRQIEENEETSYLLIEPGPSCGCDWCKDIYGLNIIGWAKRIWRTIRKLWKE